MILLPVRSEKETKGYPNLTIALIAINLIIWIYTNRIVSTEYKKIGNIHKRLQEIEYYYLGNMIKEHPNLLLKKDINSVRQILLEKDIIPKDNQLYQEWLGLYNEFQNLKTNTFFHRWGFIPARLNILKLLISIFLHGSFFHVFGNMLYLWIVGCNIEDDWGWQRFLGLYILSGMAAGIFHSVYSSNMTMPCVGASGAVAGIMGAFLIQHFKTKIRFAYFFLILFRPFWGTFKVGAGAVLPFWFLMEFLMARSGIQSGTAHWAHVGGFLFGAAVVTVNKFMNPKTISPNSESVSTGSATSSHGLSSNSITNQLTPIPEDITCDSPGIVKLREILQNEPTNYPVQLCLARIMSKNGYIDDAAVSYSRALDIIIELNDIKMVLIIYNELTEHDLLRRIPHSNLYQIAILLEKSGRYQKAVKLYSSYVKWHPKGIMRAKALYRAYLILKKKIGNNVLANRALAYLQKEYPDFYHTHTVKTGKS